MGDRPPRPGTGQAPASGAAVQARPPSPTRGPAPTAPPPPPPPPMRKLRFLALHGYGQTAESFRTRIGSLRKGLKSRAEFVFMDAPFPAAPAAEDTGKAQTDAGLSWWGWEGGRPEGLRPSQADRTTVGWAESRARILAALAAHAPVDGLVAFSQGAAAAGWLLGEVAAGGGGVAWPAGVPRLRLAILAAGFVPGDPAVRAVFDQARAAAAAGAAASSPPLPTLFIAGEGDETVPPDRTGALATALGGVVTPSWLRHGGGHCLPTCSGEVKKAMVGFLDTRLGPD